MLSISAIGSAWLGILEIQPFGKKFCCFREWDRGAIA